MWKSVQPGRKLERNRSNFFLVSCPCALTLLILCCVIGAPKWQDFPKPGEEDANELCADETFMLQTFKYQEDREAFLHRPILSRTGSDSGVAIKLPLGSASPPAEGVESATAEDSIAFDPGAATDTRVEGTSPSGEGDARMHQEQQASDRYAAFGLAQASQPPTYGATVGALEGATMDFGSSAVFGQPMNSPIDTATLTRAASDGGVLLDGTPLQSSLGEQVPSASALFDHSELQMQQQQQRQSQQQIQSGLLESGLETSRSLDVEEDGQGSARPDLPSSDSHNAGVRSQSTSSADVASTRLPEYAPLQPSVSRSKSFDQEARSIPGGAHDIEALQQAAINEADEARRSQALIERRAELEMKQALSDAADRIKQTEAKAEAAMQRKSDSALHHLAQAAAATESLLQRSESVVSHSEWDAGEPPGTNPVMKVLTWDGNSPLALGIAQWVAAVVLCLVICACMHCLCECAW